MSKKSKSFFTNPVDVVRDLLKRREDAAHQAATTAQQAAASTVQGGASAAPSVLMDETAMADLEKQARERTEAEAASAAQALQAEAKAAAQAAQAQAAAAAAAAAAARESATTAAAAEADKYIEYKVVYGDTLWDLAVKYYGDGMKYKDIYEANKELIGPDVNTLYPDWVLKIPRP